MARGWHGVLSGVVRGLSGRVRGQGPREGLSPATPARRPVCTRVTAVEERRNETPCFVFDKTKLAHRR